MYRSLFLCLGVAAPVLAQPGDDRFATVQPPVATRQPVLTQPRTDTLSTEARVFSPRVDVGVVVRRPPYESDIDMEAVLRQHLPSEEALRESEARLVPMIRAMQGVWRVERMTLDGVDVHPADFAGTKYLIQNRVLLQSERAEEWNRVWPVPTVVPGTTGPRAPEEFSAELGIRRPANVPPPTPDVVPLGPAGESRAPGAERREDPREEEAVRMNFVYQRPGRARVFWWNRYGESADPHMTRNRPSLRVALPIRGNVTVAENTMTVDVRGFGLRSVLPSKFHLPLNPLAPGWRSESSPLVPERRLSLVLVRDEVVIDPVPDAIPVTGSIRQTRPNIIPTMRRVPFEWGR